MSHVVCEVDVPFQSKFAPCLQLPHPLLYKRFLLPTSIFGRPFVKRFALRYAIEPLSCPVLTVCLPVTLVYCSQTVGWIKMPLDTEVGLCPGDIVLDGDPAPPQKGRTAFPTFRPTLLWHGRPSQQLLSYCC